MYFANGFDVDVYRKPRIDLWEDDYAEGDTTGIRELYGLVKSHTLENCTVGPRVDEAFPKKAANEPTAYTGATLFCDPEDDIRSNDVVHWVDASGRSKVYEVEGIGDSDFISPFSGWSGGKEVYIGTYRTKAG